MKITITADSTCDLPKDLIEKYNIKIINIPVIMGDMDYRESIDAQTVFDYVAKTNILPKTAALSVFEYKEAFENELKSADVVIHFSLSFGISSTGNNALLASQELNNVYVIDTKNLSGGSGILILRACDKIKENKNIETIIKELNEESENIQTSFLISKLNYLRKGGRCSSIALFGANVLGLKIIVQVIDGKMQATKKYAGKVEKCLSKYLNDIVKERPPVLERAMVISSSKMPGIRENFAEEVKKLGFEEVLVGDACATITSHCGPDTIGVLYLAK